MNDETCFHLLQRNSAKMLALDIYIWIRIRIVQTVN